MILKGVLEKWESVIKIIDNDGNETGHTGEIKMILNCKERLKCLNRSWIKEEIPELCNYYESCLRYLKNCISYVTGTDCENVQIPTQNILTVQEP